MAARSRSFQNIVRCTCEPALTNIVALRGSIGFRKEKNMKTLLATVILAMAIASPALAQRAPSGAQHGYQQNGTYNGYPLSEWYRTDEW